MTSLGEMSLAVRLVLEGVHGFEVQGDVTLCASQATLVVGSVTGTNRFIGIDCLSARSALVRFAVVRNKGHDSFW